MLARMQKSMKEKDQGFTLIELLVVIVIIGILAAIAIPVFLNQRKKGIDASLKSDLKNAGQRGGSHHGRRPGQDYGFQGGHRWRLRAGVRPATCSRQRQPGDGNFCLGHNPGEPHDNETAEYKYNDLAGGLQSAARRRVLKCGND